MDYFKALVQDKAGDGARILSALLGEGIDLLAFTGFPRGRKTQLDFVPENGPAFRKAAKKAGLAVTKNTAFLVQGQDRPGAVAEIVSKLADAGVSIPRSTPRRGRRAGTARSCGLSRRRSESGQGPRAT